MFDERIKLIIKFIVKKLIFSLNRIANRVATIHRSCKSDATEAGLVAIDAEAGLA